MHVLRLENLVLRWQDSPNWLLYSRQSLSKSQLPVLQKLASVPEISYENASDSEWPKQSWKQRTKLDSHTSRFQNLIQKATVIQTLCIGIRWIDLQNIIRAPEINPHTYGQRFSKRVPRQFKGGKNSLWQMVLGPLAIRIQNNEAGPIPHSA